MRQARRTGTQRRCRCARIANPRPRKVGRGIHSALATSDFVSPFFTNATISSRNSTGYAFMDDLKRSHALATACERTKLQHRQVKLGFEHRQCFFHLFTTRNEKTAVFRRAGCSPRGAPRAEGANGSVQRSVVLADKFNGQECPFSLHAPSMLGVSPHPPPRVLPKVAQPPSSSAKTQRKMTGVVFTAPG